MKVYDGFHPVHYEIEKSGIKFKDSEMMGKGSTQKIYVFPNCYGASVINGSFTFGKDELAVIWFPDPYFIRSKKKRFRKKLYKRLGGHVITYDTPITDDVKRYINKDDLNRDLNLIAKLKAGS